MATKARYFVTKGKRLEQKLHNIQSEIYNLSSELEDAGQPGYAETVTDSGFELDVAHSKMKEFWTKFENAYCRKISK